MYPSLFKFSWVFGNPMSLYSIINLLQSFVRKSHIRSRIWVHDNNMVTRYKYYFVITISADFFLASPHFLLEPSSPTRNGTRALTSENEEIQPLDGQGTPPPPPTFIYTKVGSNRISTTAEMMSFYLLKTHNLTDWIVCTADMLIM